MIHVNARAIIVREEEGKLQIVIQKRTKKGEECYELPGGRIEEYESITDALRREVMEETGLQVISIEDEQNSLKAGNTFYVQGIRPFSAYQTLEGPVDSFGLHFVVRGTGSLLEKGDDTAEIHWAAKDEIIQKIRKNEFSGVDEAALLMYFKQRFS